MPPTSTNWSIGLASVLTIVVTMNYRRGPQCMVADELGVADEMVRSVRF